MNYTGGYQIVDLGNHNFENGEPFVVSGVYNLVGRVKKPFYVSGIVVDGVEYHDSFIQFIDKSGSFNGSNGILDFTVDSDDSVFITVHSEV